MELWSEDAQDCKVQLSPKATPIMFPGGREIKTKDSPAAESNCRCASPENVNGLRPSGCGVQPFSLSALMVELSIMEVCV